MTTRKDAEALIDALTVEQRRDAADKVRAYAASRPAGEAYSLEKLAREIEQAMPTPAEKPPARETEDPCPSCGGVGRLDSLHCVCPACHGKRKRVDAPARSERRG